MMLESIKFSVSWPVSSFSEHRKCGSICMTFYTFYSLNRMWGEAEQGQQKGQTESAVSSKHVRLLIFAQEACLSLTQMDKVMVKSSWYWVRLLHLYWYFRSQEVEGVRKYKIYEKHLHLISDGVTMTTEYVNTVCYKSVTAVIYRFITGSNSSMGEQ